jgi:hypothetical protein
MDLAMADISEFGLIVLELPSGFEFHPTGKFLFRDKSNISPQKIQEVWRGHPQWGFHSRSSYTANPAPDRQISTAAVPDLGKA